MGWLRIRRVCVCEVGVRVVVLVLVSSVSFSSAVLIRLLTDSSVDGSVRPQDQGATSVGDACTIGPKTIFCKFKKGW